MPALDAVVYRSGKVILKGNYDLKPLDGDVAFHLRVNLTDETYTATPYTPAELQEMNARNNLERLLRNSTKSPKTSEPQQMNMMAATMYLSLSLSLTTEDIPQWDLARTTAAVAWSDDGVNLKFTYANASFFAEQSSPVGTTWYVGYADSGLTYPVNVTAPTNFGWAIGSYYNYDWWDDNLITTAYQ